MAIDLTPLGYAAARIEERNADIFVGVGSFSNDDQLFSIGAVRDVTADGTARVTTADSHGRTYQRGVDLVVSWEVMQTNYAVEFATLPDLISANNVMLKVTDVAVAYEQGADEEETLNNLSTAAHAASGIEFQNINLNMDFGLNFDGDDSTITLTANMRLSLEQIKMLGLEPIVFGG